MSRLRRKWADEFPELLQDWASDKDPNNVACREEVEWKCKNGHLWKATPARRFQQGSGCPFCSGRMATVEKNLLVDCPKLANEWDFIRNGFGPEMILSRSNKKVWWKCEKGHEWLATVLSRAYGNGCPYCSGYKASPEKNLLVSYPEIAREIHPVKNGKVIVGNITPHSERRLWWKCSRGHEWNTKVASRTSSRGTSGCPKCGRQFSILEIRLYCEVESFFKRQTEWKAHVGGKEMDVYIPSLGVAIEIDGWYWHQNRIDADLSKNGKAEELGLKLVRVRERPLPLMSDSDVSYDYNEDHFQICSRVIGSIGRMVGIDVADYQSIMAEDAFLLAMSKIDTPKNNLQDRSPDLAKEWHPTKNGPLKPENFACKSGQSVWWMCPKGHEWKIRICNRSNGSGCPYCSNRQGNVRSK